MRWLGLIWLTTVCFCQSAGAQSPLQIDSALWGFSGRPLPQAFNPLTLQISNRSETPFAATLHLERRLGNRRVGIRQSLEASLAPGGSRQVSFTPYIDAMFDRYAWHLVWERGDLPLEGSLLPRALGQAATVEISPRSPLENASGNRAFPRFPSEAFPTNPSASAGLAAVIFTQAPQWQASRAEAFWHWLQRGGQLHLFPGASGQALNFDGPLAPLNDPSLTKMGHGQVHRYSQSLDKLDANTLTKLQPRSSSTSPQERGKAFIFRSFGYLTNPRIPWPWIYLAAFVYLILIGPCHYHFAKKTRRDYRVTLLLLLLGISGFAWLFSKIGRRGFGESDRWLQASIAHPVGNEGRYDVLHWSHVFVTTGKDYHFRLGDRHQLFEVEHQLESVPGTLWGGPQGHLELEIPLFSSRNLLGRSLLSGPEMSIEVRAHAPARRDIDIAIKTPQKIERAWYRSQNRYYELMESATNRWGYKKTDASWESLTFDPPAKGASGEAEGRGYVEALLPQCLLHWHRHAHDQQGPASETDELLLYAEAPASFAPQPSGFDRPFNRVLYVIPLAHHLSTPSR